MKQVYLVFCSMVLYHTSNAQIVREQITPLTIASEIPAYSQVSSINTVSVAYTPPIPATEPTPIDGDTTTEGNGMYDFGSILPVSFTLNDGNFTSTTLGKVWTLRITVSNALSVGLTFNQFNLSSSAEMYIYNDTKTVLNKAIKKADFTNTDTVSISSINGNSVIVYIIEPNNFGNFQSTVSINELVGGYQEISDVGDANNGILQRASINCIPQIQCYPGHLNSARAVARIQIPKSASIVAQCTGTLINNEQNNGRAYFLTAFHCVDANNNKIIDCKRNTCITAGNFSVPVLEGSM